MIKSAIRERVRIDLLNNVSIAKICKRYHISPNTARGIRDHDTLPVYSVPVLQFRCAMCGTLNYLKRRKEDRVCLACSVKRSKTLLFLDARK